MEPELTLGVWGVESERSVAYRERERVRRERVRRMRRPTNLFRRLLLLPPIRPAHFLLLHLADTPAISIALSSQTT
jgi:hypothetical protein